MLLFAFQSLKHALLLAPCAMVLANALLLLRVPFSGYIKDLSPRAILKHAAVLHAVWVSLFTVIACFIPGPGQAEKLGVGSLIVMWLACGPVPALAMLGIGSMIADPDDTA